MLPLSLATTNGISIVLAYELIYFPHATEMFHFAWFPHTIPHGIAARTLPVRGFPHSDIHGSKLIASSPRLFAGCCVLRRLILPRHPPYTLNLF